MAQFDILEIIEVIGVAAFAASGAIVAVEKKLDIFGILVLAFVTAVGGGVIRDVVMNRGIPVFFSNYLYSAVILTVAVAVMLLRGKIRWGWPFVIIDALGLAVFTTVAGMMAIESGYTFLAFLFVSVITGVGGSMMRDVLVQEIPAILHKEIYATAVIAGVLALWFLHQWLGRDLAVALAMAIVFTVRVVCYRKDVHLSFFHKGNKKGQSV